MAEEVRERDLEKLLGVEPIGDDRFSKSLQGFEGVSFGGQTLGCAVSAAADTCPGRGLHSLAAVFMKRVPADLPVEFRVERIAEGKRFARRRVSVHCGGPALCEFVASFASPGQGPEYQDAAFPSDVTQPEELPTEEDVAKAQGLTDWFPSPLDLRWVGNPWEAKPHEHSRYLTWLRTRIDLPKESATQAAAIAYTSDFHSHWPVVRKLNLDSNPYAFSSLDNVLWIHRDEAWDDWRLLVTESDVAYGGRALSRRQLFSREGTLLASMAQEALIPGAS